MVWFWLWLLTRLFSILSLIVFILFRIRLRIRLLVSLRIIFNIWFSINLWASVWVYSCLFLVIIYWGIFAFIFHSRFLLFSIFVLWIFSRFSLSISVWARFPRFTITRLLLTRFVSRITRLSSCLIISLVLFLISCFGRTLILLTLLGFFSLFLFPRCLAIYRFIGILIYFVHSASGRFLALGWLQPLFQFTFCFLISFLIIRGRFGIRRFCRVTWATSTCLLLVVD